MPDDSLNSALDSILSQQISFGEISCRMLVETYAPAAVLINRHHQILHSVGPVGDYLCLPAGQLAYDLLEAAPADFRARLHAAIQEVFRDQQPIRISGEEMLRRSAALPFGIDVLPVTQNAEPLQLICFVPAPGSDMPRKTPENLAIGSVESDEGNASAKRFGQHELAEKKIARLTPRERQIMKMVVAGRPSKIIATDLGISQRTVENHRAAVMRKTESRSLPTLARLAFASGLSDI